MPVTHRTHCCEWRDLLPFVPQCDALIVDAPYSAKTHRGHDGGTIGDRRAISYAAWDPEEVTHFVNAWAPRTDGWFVTITDHILAADWSASLEAQGRYVFAPLPFVAPGSRVRLAGDGPSSWSCWIVVARPRTKKHARWGTLPGAYVLPKGQGGRMPIVGGKPVWLMHRLAEDYSRPGELIVDPCMGAGTTLIGAIRAGNRAVGSDVNPTAVEIAEQWLRNPHGPAPSSRQPKNQQQEELIK